MFFLLIGVAPGNFFLFFTEVNVVLPLLLGEALGVSFLVTHLCEGLDWAIWNDCRTLADLNGNVANLIDEGTHEVNVGLILNELAADIGNDLE